MRKLLFLLACFFLASVGLVSAQSRTITGKVISADDGEPVIGASVSVKGTTVGTVTNENGAFTINAAAGRTLLVRFVGMVTLEVAAENNMVIKLSPDRLNLSEVIVTGMGLKREQKALGYSATQVSSADLTTTGNRSALNALQGKIPGVEITSASGAPGSSTKVIMRGYTSLGSGNGPLYVIDGVPMNNGVVNNTSLNGGMDFGNRANDINPDDIESITVLQSGSGTAIYGSRASSGVILITTKNGSRAGSKAKVDFSSTTMFDSPLRLPKVQNEFGQGWYNRSTDRGGDLMENGSWGPRFDGKIHKWGFVVDNQQQIKPYVALPTNIADFFDTGLTLNNSVSVSNGDENKSFYVSYSNVYSDGIMPTEADSYKRNTMAARGSVKFLDIFNLSASLNYVRKDSRFVITGQDQSVLDAIWQNGRDISIVDQEDYNNKFNNVENYYTAYSQNPYYVLNEHGTRFGEDRVFGNIGLEARIYPWLTATAKVGGDFSNSTLKAWRAITNNSSYDYIDEVGRVSEGAYNSSEFNADFMLLANKKINDDFKVNGTIGYSFNQRKSRSMDSEVIGLDIPGFYNLANSSKTPTISAGTTNRIISGLFASAELDYKSMVYLNLSGRKDVSSTLPAAHRSYNYPGASLSFIFTELMEDKGILSYGKIRVGAAKTGKDATPYNTFNIMNQTAIGDGYRTLEFPLVNGDNTVNAFSVSNTMRNDKLRPEMTRDQEIGLDLKFLNNRVSTSVTLYDKTVTDMIWASSIPNSTGYQYQIQNLGKLTNKGIEVSINVTPIQTRDIKWDVYANYSRNKNMLMELNDGLEVITLGGTSRMNYVARPGHPLGLFEGAVPATDGAGHVVVDGDGLPTFADEYSVLGTSQNDFRIGGGTNLSYKNFTVTANFDYRKGGVMYSRTAEILYFTGNALPTTFNDRQPFVIPNSVQADGNGGYVENSTPISGFAHTMNSYYNQTYNAGIGAAYSLLDKTFFKLRELSIAYEVPKQSLPSMVSRLSIALVGNNLFMWTPNSNLYSDPEQTTFGNDLESDYGDFGATPTTRSIGFNVKLGF